MSPGDNIKTIFFAILCICFISYLCMGIYSYKRDKKSKVNVIFFRFCISAGLWVMGYAVMLISPNIRIANIGRIISIVGLCFFNGVLISFAFALKETDKRSSKHKIEYLVYIISLIFSVINLLYKPSKAISSEVYGFVDILYTTTTIGIIYSIYVAVLSIAGLVIIYFQLINSKKNRVRKQLKTILITSLISFCLAVMLNIIFPLLGIVVLQFGNVAFFIGMAGMWYAINKHKMMSISYELVSEYIFEAVNEPIFIIGEDLLVKSCNEASQNITGYNYRDLKKKLLHEIINFRNFNFNTIIQAGNVINIEVDLHRKKKEGLVCELSATVIYDEYKDVLGTLILLHDVSERKIIDEIQKKYTLKLEESNLKLKDEITERLLVEERIRHFIYYDALTEIFNRKKMLEDINLLLDYKDEKFAILFIDLDKFKSANDNYGHQAGDDILKTVVMRLKNIICPTDTIYRIGGDEFIIILRDLKDSANAEKIAVAALETLSTAFTYKENQLFIGASIGISISPEHGIDEDTLIKKSDLAMYEVKHKGGNGYKMYSLGMEEEELDNLIMIK